MTAAAPAAQTALADDCVPNALNATKGLIDGIDTVVAAPAAVELKHNAQPRSAPRIWVEGFEDIATAFLRAGGRLGSG